MGLTGFITRATIQLKRVESALVKVDTVKTRDIDETMAVLAEHDRKYGYTVAWSDDLATGGQPRPVDHHQRRLRGPRRPGRQAAKRPVQVRPARQARGAAASSRPA